MAKRIPRFLQGQKHGFYEPEREVEPIEIRQREIPDYVFGVLSPEFKTTKTKGYFKRLRSDFQKALNMAEKMSQVAEIAGRRKPSLLVVKAEAGFKPVNGRTGFEFGINLGKCERGTDYELIPCTVDMNIVKAEAEKYMMSD